MDKRTFKKLTAAAGIGASLLVGSSFVSSAWAAPCAAGSVATYTAPGFSCTVGPLTFSNFNVIVTTSGPPAIVNFSATNAFNPDILTVGGHTEYGFDLGYLAAASGVGFADIGVKYDVSAAPGTMNDAYMAYTGTAIGGGSFTALTESFSNGQSMSLVGQGAKSITFAPIGSLQAIKDQSNVALDGVAVSSLLVDGFSVPTGVPEPGTIALFGAGLLGGAFFLRRRKLSN